MRFRFGDAPDVNGLRMDSIETNSGTPYLDRYHVEYGRERCVRFHHWLGSDDQRAHHDHPWANTSIVITGRLREHDEDGSRLLKAGDLIVRSATKPHAIELLTRDAWTLFITGPIERRWGFYTERGWVHWLDYEFAGRYQGDRPLLT